MRAASSGKSKPLASVRILVGRARRQAGALSPELKKLGAEVIEIPFIEIRSPRSHEPFDTALRRLAQYDWLIVTSVNGAEALQARMKRLRMRPTELSHLQIAAIGPATRGALRAMALKVTIVPERYVAESVVKSLRGKVKGKRVLLARAKVARDVIPCELRKAGARVDVAEAYETVMPSGSRKKLRSLMDNPARRPHIITFTSSSTVRNFIGLLGAKDAHPLRSIKLASIGPITSATLRECGLRADIEAKEYTIPGLVRAIVEFSRAGA